MTIKEIWVARHGYREDWVNPNPTYPTGLRHDSPLSESGRQQAQELCSYLENKDIQAVYSSPFYRVLETVYPLVEKTKIPLYRENMLGEWYGKSYDRYQTPASNAELTKFFPLLDTSHDTIDLPIDIETVIECHERANRGLEKLIKILDSENKYERILLAGHAASVICVVRALLKDIKFPVRAGTASLSRLVRMDDGKGGIRWEIKENGDCLHLSQGEQRSWMFSGDTPDYSYKNAV